MSTTTTAAAALIAALAIPAFAAAAAPEGATLGYEEAVEAALRSDEWLRASELREASLREEATAAGQLPDPRMNVGLNNMPIDSFDFGQEPMTQFEVGFSQAFPPGDTLELQERQLLQRSRSQQPQRQDRRASVALEVGGLWLDAFLAQELIGLHVLHRDLLEQLVEAAAVRYQAAQGSFRQQDLLRAELELTRVDDVLIELRRRLDESRRRLARWLPFELLEQDIAADAPELEPPRAPALAGLDEAAAFFARHPRLRAFDRQIEAALTGVDLARQSYKPGYTLGGRYGYREDGPQGLARSDFFSVSVTLDLPLFTGRRQDARVRAASLQASSLQAERVLLLRELAARYQAARERLARLEERGELYESTFPGQLDTLAEASMASYAAGDGDFDELIQSYISRHLARIEAREIAVERLKTVLELNYLTTQSDNAGDGP